MKTRENERRNSGIIIILIFLLGFICIILASGWALRFAPSWKLDTDMGSNLNPNSVFLTSRPVSFIEPLDPAILTNPAWFNVFLTPGASFETRTPMPADTATLAPVRTNTPIPPSPTASLTNIPAITVIPTNTRTPLPSTAVTGSPNPSPTNTPVTPLPSAELQALKTDGMTTYTPGSTLIYVVIVQNNGGNTVTGAIVTDNKPVQITTWSWVCTSQTGGATGCNGVTGSNTDFTDTVNLPSGASIMYTVTSNISAGAVGNLINIASISAPPGYSDPIPGNNSATDTDISSSQTDLAITKTDGSATYTAGNAITYTLVVSNAGPSNATGASVADAIPAAITGTTINCVASGAASCGTDASVGNNLSYTSVNIPAGAGNFLTITVNGTVNPATTGNLVNTATVTAGAGQTDSALGNNSATDTDTQFIPPSADLQITKTDGSATYTAGSPITYTIVVSNAGPSNATGASVTDTIPASITGTTINCVASGAASCGTDASAGNNLSYTNVNIPAGIGNFLTITVNGTVNPATTGNLVNTATVTAGSPIDPSLGNNTATDTDTQFIPPTADLQITKDDGVASYPVGGNVTYTIIVANNGPSGVIAAVVTDTIPAQITTWDWNCTAQNGGATGCDGVAGSSADFNDTVNLPNGASIVYTVTANISATATANLVNTATVTEPFGITDPNTANNSDTDTDYGSLYGDIGTGRDDLIETLLPGSSIILALSPQALVNGDLGAWDIIYYEEAAGSGIDMDRIILEIGDGTTWYTILNWGDGAPDVATNIDTAVLGTCAGEPDNCPINALFLFNGTGVAIDLDNPSLGIPLGSYPFLRITVPGGSGNVGIDGIFVIIP